jgi:hypothetical protein
MIMMMFGLPAVAIGHPVIAPNDEHPAREQGYNIGRCRR